MQLHGQRSWQIRINRWMQEIDWALWLRAVENINVPRGGIVPGSLADAPPPSPSVPAGTDLVEGWAAWWHALVALPSLPKPAERRPTQLAFQPPDFPGLEGWPR